MFVDVVALLAQSDTGFEAATVPLVVAGVAGGGYLPLLIPSFLLLILLHLFLFLDFLSHLAGGHPLPSSSSPSSSSASHFFLFFSLSLSLSLSLFLSLFFSLLLPASASVRSDIMSFYSFGWNSDGIPTPPKTDTSSHEPYPSIPLRWKRIRFNDAGVSISRWPNKWPPSSSHGHICDQHDAEMTTTAHNRPSAAIQIGGNLLVEPTHGLLEKSVSSEIDSFFLWSFFWTNISPLPWRLSLVYRFWMWFFIGFCMNKYQDLGLRPWFCAVSADDSEADRQHESMRWMFGLVEAENGGSGHEIGGGENQRGASALQRHGATEEGGAVTRAGEWRAAAKPKVSHIKAELIRKETQ